MSELQKDVELWRGKITELIKVIYQVKDGALRTPFGEDAKWHEKLSHVTAELGTACRLGVSLGRTTATR